MPLSLNIPSDLDKQFYNCEKELNVLDEIMADQIFVTRFRGV